MGTKKDETRPKGLKKVQVDIPVELTEHDKAVILQDIVNLQIENEGNEEELAKVRAQHKDTEKEHTTEIGHVNDRIDAKLQVARKGFTEEPTKCFERKNFNETPAIMEYVNDKGEVLHTFPLRPDQYQITVGEWAIGTPPEKVEGVSDEKEEAFEQD